MKRIIMCTIIWHGSRYLVTNDDDDDDDDDDDHDHDHDHHDDDDDMMPI